MQSHQHIELLSELGIALLLFLVGLKLDLKLIKTLGVVSLATGLGQVLFTSTVGFFIGLLLGYSPITSLYIAVALTFSSTIIIIKLLSDKKEVDSLHGKIAIGFLIVQDLVVVLAMMVLSALGVRDAQASETNSWIAWLRYIMIGFGFVVFFVVFIRSLATPLMKKIVRSTELMVTFAIGWACLFAVLGDYLGFSKELGGLLAGVSLSSTPFRENILTRLSSLRDFLLLFFFISLGSKLEFHNLSSQLFSSSIFSLFVLIGNPIIVMIIMGWMGYRKRTGFLAGLTVAQISEFSLIFIAMGISLGHIPSQALATVTLVGLTTIALSVYMITYSEYLYRWLSPALHIFERKNPFREKTENEYNLLHNQYDIVIFGLGRYGSALANHLLDQNQKILAIDFNPEVIQKAQKQGFTALYGDVHDEDFIHSLPLKNVKWIILATPQHEWGLTHEDPRIVLLETLKQIGFQGKIALSTHIESEVFLMKSRGADLVFVPYQYAASQVIDKIVL